jgi:hypothetical protein
LLSRRETRHARQCRKCAILRMIRRGEISANRNEGRCGSKSRDCTHVVPPGRRKLSTRVRRGLAIRGAGVAESHPAACGRGEQCLVHAKSPWPCDPRRRRAAKQRHELPSPHARTLRLRHISKRVAACRLISIASRILLHFLQLLLFLKYRPTEPISERHVLQGEPEQCCCDARGRACNGDLRCPISHLPVIFRSRHRPSATPAAQSRFTAISNYRRRRSARRTLRSRRA